MSKQQNGQRAQAIRMGSIRPAAADLVIGVKVKTAEDIAKSRAKAIAARRKEFAKA
jgi:hypothetical protein